METVSHYLIEFVRAENNPVGLLTLAGSAMLEYVVPPFPGDTITLFGAVLVTAYGWSGPWVFFAVMLGSSAGAMLAFALGVVLGRRSTATPAEQRTILRSLVEKFERHGAWYLVLNRFVPGIRSLFFVAAGLAKMRPHKVLFFSALSAAIWNGGLFAIGAAVGANLDELMGLVRVYQTGAWIVVGVVIAVFIYRFSRGRRRPAVAIEDESAGTGSAAAASADTDTRGADSQ